MTDPVLLAATMGLSYGGAPYGVTGYAIEARYFTRGSGGVVQAGAGIVTPPPAGTARR